MPPTLSLLLSQSSRRTTGEVAGAVGGVRHNLAAQARAGQCHAGCLELTLGGGMQSNDGGGWQSPLSGGGYGRR